MPFKPGQSGNPKGRKPGRQAFVDRANYLLDKYNVGDIKAFINDERQFDKLPSYDAMIMRRVVEAVSENGHRSMDSLLDRLIGKPAQAITGEDGGPIEVADVSDRERLKETCRSIAFMLSEATQEGVK